MVNSARLGALRSSLTIFFDAGVPPNPMAGSGYLKLLHLRFQLIEVDGLADKLDSVAHFFGAPASFSTALMGIDSCN
jgi:hypothetical protein